VKIKLKWLKRLRIAAAYEAIETLHPILKHI
jgi:hypothetical protein